MGYQLVFILIVGLISPEMVLAMGQGFAAGENKTLSPKDCPINTEYRIRNKGVATCWPKPIEDPRCNADFVNKFSLKQDCFRGTDPAACLSYAASAVGVVGGAAAGAAVASAFKFANPTKDFLEKFNRVYGAVRENQDLSARFYRMHEEAEAEAEEAERQEKLRQYRGAMKNGLPPRLEGDFGLDPEEKKSVERRAREWMRRELNKPWQGKLREIFMKLKNSPAENKLSAVASAYLNDQSEQLISEEFPGEAAEYARLKKPFDEIINKAGEDPVAKKRQEELEEKVEQLRTEKDKITDQSSKEYKDVKQKFQQAFNEKMKFAADASEKREKIYDETNEKFDTLLKEKYPHLRLLNTLTSRAGKVFMHTPETTEKIVQQQAELEKKSAAVEERNAVKNKMTVATSGVAGAVAGGMVVPVVSAVASNQVSLCADKLKIRGDELGFVESQISSPSANICRTIRLRNPKEALLFAQDKFGFVPTGVCELALRENQTLNAVLEGETPKVSCDSIQTSGFKSVNHPDGTKSFTCSNTGTGFTYTMPLKADGEVDWSRKHIKATVEGGGRLKRANAEARKMVDELAKFEEPDRYTDLSEVEYQNSTATSGSVQFGKPDYASCYLKSRLNKAMMDVLSMSGTCTPNSNSGGPANLSPSKREK